MEAIFTRNVGRILTFNSAVGQAAGSIGVHIYATQGTDPTTQIIPGNAPFKLHLKLNGNPYREFENIPACVTPENLNNDPANGPEEYNAILPALPSGKYTWVIDDSIEANVCRMSEAYNLVSPNSIVMYGDVNCGGVPTQVWFDYGLTAAYGSVIEVGEMNGFDTGIAFLEVPYQVAGQTNVPGSLLPGTTYHYRIRIHNANGDSTGLDMTVATPAQPPVCHTLPAIVN